NLNKVNDSLAVQRENKTAWRSDCYPDLFESGVLSTTPPYLAEHERMVLNRIRKSRQERSSGDEGGVN
ncbi:MAG: hypothetical protein ACI4GX_10290, partial [Ruminococcus sp.]